MDWITVVSAFLSSQAFGVIIGGLITTGNTYFLEMRRRKDDEKKRRQESFVQEIQRRNDAYIKFLSLKYADVCKGPQDHVIGDITPEGLGLESALVLAYGNPFIALELAESFPFKSWNDVKAVQDKIVEELKDDRIGRGPLWPPDSI